MLARLAPGLGVVGGVTLVAYHVSRLPGFSLLGHLVLALLGGMLVRGLLQPELRPRSAARLAVGYRFAARALLRLGIVMLGVRLDLRLLAQLGPTVLVGSVLGIAVGFGAVELIGRRWGVAVGLRRLVAVGTAICGASAIAASLPVVRAEERDASIAVGAVSILGTLGVLLFVAAESLSVAPTRLLAATAGASLQEVGHVVAASSALGGEGEASSLALLIKLSRVVLLAPVLIALAWLARREARRSQLAAPGEVAPAPLPPLVPLFVLGFVAVSAATSLGWLSGTVVVGLSSAATWLTAAAMAGIGIGVPVRGLGPSGRHALGLGAVGFVALLLAMLAYYTLAGFSG